MTSQRKTQTAISCGSLLLAGLHLLWPGISLDAVTLTLLGGAAVPWLLPLFKSLELPGGWKIEFQELQATEQRADKAGLLDEEPADSGRAQEYSFQVVANQDANLALAGLRIEIERRLNSLADGAGIKRRKMGMSGLLRSLSDREVLSHEERSVLRDMIGLLNSAAHGASADQQHAQWVLDVGPRLLATLDKRIDQE